MNNGWGSSWGTSWKYSWGTYLIRRAIRIVKMPQKFLVFPRFKIGK
jgi:hypothetical protein